MRSSVAWAISGTAATAAAAAVSFATSLAVVVGLAVALFLAAIAAAIGTILAELVLRHMIDRPRVRLLPFVEHDITVRSEVLKATTIHRPDPSLMGKELFRARVVLVPFVNGGFLSGALTQCRLEVYVDGGVYEVQANVTPMMTKLSTCYRPNADSSDLSREHYLCQTFYREGLPGLANDGFPTAFFLLRTAEGSDTVRIETVDPFVVKKVGETFELGLRLTGKRTDGTPYSSSLRFYRVHYNSWDSCDLTFAREFSPRRH